jgi:hypothetical protein
MHSLVQNGAAQERRLETGMSKLALIALFALSLGSLSFAASYLPTEQGAPSLSTLAVADLELR